MRKIKQLIILGIATVLLGCATFDSLLQTDPYKVDYNKFNAQLPSAHWQKITDSHDLNLSEPQLVNIYFKKDSGSVILVRSGRKSDFGVPADYDLTQGQMIYLIKLVPKGDLLEAVEYENQNPFLEKVKKLHKFSVQHPQLGAGQITAGVFLRGEMVLIEMFSPQASAASDEQDFYLFLNSLQERKKE